LSGSRRDVCGVVLRTSDWLEDKTAARKVERSRFGRAVDRGSDGGINGREMKYIKTLFTSTKSKVK